MSTYNEMMYCAQCEKHTLHLRDKTNHILHLILCFVTLGVWLFIWPLIAFGNSLGSQCTVCGRTLNWTRDKPPRKVHAAPTPKVEKTMEELLRDGDA